MVRFSKQIKIKTMLNFKHKKEHPLVGYSFTAKDESEFRGFCELVGVTSYRYHGNDHTYLIVHDAIGYYLCIFTTRTESIGQQVTLDELKTLVELSKLDFPCQMEVNDGYSGWRFDHIDGFYKGLPITDRGSNYFTYPYYRLQNSKLTALKTKKAELLAELENVRKEMEGLK